MLKKIVLLLLAVIVVLAIVVAMQPNTFHVARSATMAAPPAAVFAQVNDFHNWQEWSPWAKIDPKAKATFEGPAAGKDAVFKWDGNDEVGKGSMTIVESKPNELVRIRLDFEKPMQDTANVEFTLKPSGEKTDVTWSMSGDNNFVGKAMCLVMNMDKMVGEKYAEGLASMKKIVEAPPKAAADTPDVTPQPAEAPDPLGAFNK